jgi:hypothetical protein
VPTSDAFIVSLARFLKNFFRKYFQGGS